MTDGALDGLVIADFGRVLAGPYATMLLADLTALLRADTADGWFTRLTAVGVPCGPLNDLTDAFALAERLGLHPVVEIPDGPAGTGGPARQVANPIRLSATPPQYRTAPPRLGQDGGGP